MTYTTIQGQTWDMIAKKVYDDEIYADQLMAANFRLLDYFVFPEGIEITVPDLNVSKSYLPYWRAED